MSPQKKPMSVRVPRLLKVEHIASEMHEMHADLVSKMRLIKINLEKIKDPKIREFLANNLQLMEFLNVKIKKSLIEMNYGKVADMFEELNFMTWFYDESINRMVHGKFNPVFHEINLHDFNSLIENISDVLSNYGKHKISFNSLIDKKSRKIVADDIGLLRVISNLFSNALKATRHLPEQKGKIKIETSISEDSANFIITFSDNGMGLDTQSIKKFNAGKDFQVNPRYSSGFGLMNAREIVEAHNGTIAVIPGSKNGTTFKITLPLHK